MVLKRDKLKANKPESCIWNLNWPSPEWLIVANYHFQYEAVEHCVPLSLCIYGVLSKAQRTKYCLYMHYGWFTLYSPLSNSHTHFLLSLQTAFPEDTEEAVVVLPTLPPSLSFSVSPSLSAHGNNTVGSKFFCAFVSLWWKKGGRACVCLCLAWLITPTLCSISWIVHIPWLASKKKKSSHSLWQVSKQYSCQNNHTPLPSSHLIYPEAMSFQIKNTFKVKNKNREGLVAKFLQQDWLRLESICKHNHIKFTLNVKESLGRWCWRSTSLQQITTREYSLNLKEICSKADYESANPRANFE